MSRGHGGHECVNSHVEHLQLTQWCVPIVSQFKKIFGGQSHQDLFTDTTWGLRKRKRRKDKLKLNFLRGATALEDRVRFPGLSVGREATKSPSSTVKSLPTVPFVFLPSVPKTSIFT